MDKALAKQRASRSGKRSERKQTLAHHSCASRGGGGRHRNTSLPLFRPGDSVPESGIYEVIHDADHRQAHDAVMIMGNRFPTCETCNERVRFRIVRTAPYIFQDQDFEEQP
ncbi:MAG TPA: hypothetical protein VGL89_08300 [Candidatus Koribacter sp.]|jgi:hypothetical protein